MLKLFGCLKAREKSKPVRLIRANCAAVVDNGIPDYSAHLYDRQELVCRDAVEAPERVAAMVATATANPAAVADCKLQIQLLLGEM